MLFVAWKVAKRTKWIPSIEADITSGKAAIDAMDDLWEERKPRNILERIWFWIAWAASVNLYATLEQLRHHSSSTATLLIRAFKYITSAKLLSFQFQSHWRGHYTMWRRSTRVVQHINKNLCRRSNVEIFYFCYALRGLSESRWRCPMEVVVHSL